MGTRHGPAKVVATVDGIASEAAAVQVTPVKRAMLIPLIPGAPADGGNSATGISADGTAVIGNGDTSTGAIHAFRWTAAEGTADLGVLSGYDTSRAYGVNADGSVVVGTCYLAASAGDSGVPFIWTKTGGMQAIDGFPEGTILSVAYGVSGDGTRVVGFFEIDDPPSGLVGNYGFIWTQADGVKIIGDLLPFGVPRHECKIWKISADGKTMVGAAGFDLDSEDNPVAGPARWVQVGDVWDPTLLGVFPNTSGEGEAYCVSEDGGVVGGWARQESGIGESFRWTLPEGMIRPLYGMFLVTQTCSYDGTILAGSGGNPGNAFLWDVYRGYRNLYDVLDAEGILEDLEGYSPSGVMGLSADGQAMAGTAGPGIFRAFLVELPFVPPSD